MKLRIVSLVGVTLLLASAVGAQTKISGKAQCAKPEAVGTTDAGDRAGHTMTLEKYSCTWTDPLEMAGEKSKDGTSVAFADMSSTRATSTGTFVGNMDSGDKFYVSFHDSGMVKEGKPQGTKGTWTYTGGSGKLKGLTGKGTYTVTPNEDGSAAVAVEGEYAVSAVAPKKAMTKKPD